MKIEIKSKISMPQGTKIFQGDSNVDEIEITIDRYYKEYDLSTFNGYLKVKYVDDSCNQIRLIQKSFNDDIVVFYALIDKNLTRSVGTLICQPYFANDDYSVTMSSSCFNLDIEASIQAYETIEQNLLPSTLETLEYELKIAKQEFQKDIYATEGSNNAITSNAVYNMFKTVDLGAFKQEEYEHTLDYLRESGIYKISLLSQDEKLKETRLVFVNNFAFGFSKQTIFYYNTEHFLTRFATRGLSYLTATMFEPWTEYDIATKQYIDEKLGILEEDLSDILGV